jgi:DNA-binding winged helix-turn-helix (wHTH) protein
MATNYKRGPLHLDAKAEILFRGDSPVVLGQRAAALLRALMERAGVPVSKDTLIEAAWPDLTVEESNLRVQIAALQRVLGKEAGGEHWIETLPRRGYRYVGPPTAEGIATPALRLQAAPALALPDWPSIAVLPFRNMSGDAEQESFADGMVDEITTGLSRIKWAFRHSTQCEPHPQGLCGRRSARPAPDRSA